MTKDDILNQLQILSDLDTIDRNSTLELKCVVSPRVAIECVREFTNNIQPVDLSKPIIVDFSTDNMNLLLNLRVR